MIDKVRAFPLPLAGGPAQPGRVWAFSGLPSSVALGMTPRRAGAPSGSARREQGEQKRARERGCRENAKHSFLHHLFFFEPALSPGEPGSDTAKPAEPPCVWEPRFLGSVIL